jgi:hypothetical protein
MEDQLTTDVGISPPRRRVLPFQVKSLICTKEKKTVRRDCEFKSDSF